ARQPVGRSGTRCHDVCVLGAEPAVEPNRDAEAPGLFEQAAVERRLFGAPPDEVAVRSSALNRPADAFVVVERRRRDGAEVEVPLDADAVEEVGDRLFLRRCFEDLKVADEAGADVRSCFVDFYGTPGAREHDRGSETGWSRACNENWPN